MKKHDDVISWQDRDIAVRMEALFFASTFKAVKRIADGSTQSTTDHHQPLNVFKCPEEFYFTFIVKTARVNAHQFLWLHSVITTCTTCFLNRITNFTFLVFLWHKISQSHPITYLSSFCVSPRFSSVANTGTLHIQKGSKKISRDQATVKDCRFCWNVSRTLSSRHLTFCSQYQLTNPVNTGNDHFCSCKNSQLYLDARVMYIVNALQNIKRDPTANTVPGKISELALNIAPKETGPEFWCVWEAWQGNEMLCQQRNLPTAAENADMSPNAAWTAPCRRPSALRDIMALTDGNTCIAWGTTGGSSTHWVQNVRCRILGSNHARHRQKPSTNACQDWVAWNRAYTKNSKANARS